MTTTVELIPTYKSNGVKKLIRSRRFWTSTFSTIGIIATTLVPALKEEIELIIPTITAIAITMILGYTGQDIATEIRKPNSLPVIQNTANDHTDTE